MRRIICLCVILLCAASFAFAQRTRRTIPRVDKTVQASNSSIIDYRKLQLVRTLNLPPLNRENYQPWAEVIVFSPDSKILASGLENFGNDILGNLILWDTETGKMRQSIKTEGSLDSISYTSDGSIIASASGEIKLWNVITGAYLRSVGENTRSLTISPDGKTIVGGCYECSDCEDPAGVIRIWDMQTGRQKKLLDFDGTEHVPSSVAFSPNGNILASAGSTIWIWNTKNWSLLRKLKPNYEILAPIVFSPNGKILASGGGKWGERGDLTFWNMITGKLMQRLQGHTLPVSSVAFSPDGKTIASGSHDSTIKLWNVETGKLLSTLIKLKPRIRTDGVKDDDLILSLAFSPDGKTLAAGITDGVIRVWKIPE